MLIPCATCKIFCWFWELLGKMALHGQNFWKIKIKASTMQMVISCDKIFLLVSKYLSLWSNGHQWNWPLSGVFVFHKHILFNIFSSRHRTNFNQTKCQWSPLIFCSEPSTEIIRVLFTVENCWSGEGCCPWAYCWGFWLVLTFWSTSYPVNSMKKPILKCMAVP